MNAASPNEGNGGTPSHRPDGTFAPGNKLGKGNPNGKHWARLRQRVIELGQECPPGVGEDARERMLALDLWMMGLNRDADGNRTHVATKDQLHAIELLVAIYGGKKALQSDEETKDDGAVDPDALARDAAEHLRTLGLESVLPPGLKR